MKDLIWKSFRNAWYVCDMETGIYKCEDGEVKVDVWGTTLTPLGNLDKSLVVVYNNFENLLEVLKGLAVEKGGRVKVYIHNLNFYGKTIINKLDGLGYKLNISDDRSKIGTKKSLKKEGSYTYLVTGSGSWYDITIMTKDKEDERKKTGVEISFQDSKKLLPFKIKELSRDFNTSNIGYEDYINENNPPEVRSILPQDVVEKMVSNTLVLSESLKYMYSSGLYKMTIGACCFSEFKEGLLKKAFSGKFSEYNTNRNYRTIFPDLTKHENPGYLDTHTSQEDFIRKCYTGGLVMMKEDVKGNVFENGCSIDCNGIYSFVMATEKISNPDGKGVENKCNAGVYPVGVGSYFADSEYYEECCGDYFEINGNKIDGNLFYNTVKKYSGSKTYIFLHIRCCFKVKEGHAPFVRIRDDVDYKRTQICKDSRVFFNGKYYSKMNTVDGVKRVDLRDLWLSEDDFELFKEHYDVSELTVCEGYIFNTQKGMFDDYVGKWHNKKMSARSNGNLVQSTVSKLMLNNLSGKFGTKTENNVIAFNNVNGIYNPIDVVGSEKDPVYIPVAAALTSKARRVLLDAIDCNWENFLYCDTDSLHLKCKIEDIKGVVLSKILLGGWKVEHEWDKAKFLRIKCYAMEKDGVYSVTCSGMYESAKELLEATMSGNSNGSSLIVSDNYCKKFFEDLKNRGLDIFNFGLRVPGNFRPVSVKGGSCHVNSLYEILDSSL